MDYLVVYDICEPRRLRRVAKLMQRYGIRVQKSVFECCLAARALRDMKRAAARLLEPAEDSIRIYPLLRGARQEQDILGQGAIVEFPPAYIL